MSKPPKKFQYTHLNNLNIYTAICLTDFTGLTIRQRYRVCLQNKQSSRDEKAASVVEPGN